MGPKVKGGAGKASKNLKAVEKKEEVVSEKEEESASEQESELEESSDESLPGVEPTTEEEDELVNKKAAAASKKAAPAKKKAAAASRTGINNATFLVVPVSIHSILVAAISSSDNKKGMSLAGIKKYLIEHYPDKEWDKSKTFVRKALAKGLENGTFVRPKSSENATGLIGRFKINKDSKVAKKGTGVATTSSDKPKKLATAVGPKGSSKSNGPKNKEVNSTKTSTKKKEKENAVAETKGKAAKPKGKAEQKTTKGEPKKDGRQPLKTKKGEK